MAATQWARRQKFIYTSIASLVLLLISTVVYFKVFYEAPTCFDGKKNGDELGVDCGGKCERLCDFEVKPLEVRWSKFFQVRKGEYSAVAYLENINENAGIKSLPYTFRFYNNAGEIMREVEGATYVLPYTSFPIFEGRIHLSEEPASVEFSIGDDYHFIRQARQRDIPLKIENTTLMSTETRPKLSSLMLNDSIETLSDIEAVALVLDSSKEAIAASRTILPSISRETRERINFTWPEPFRPEEKVCSMPTVSVLGIDRSGSMSWAGEDPPQPLTDALRAAMTFIGLLDQKDRIGIVSYATESTVDKSVSYDKQVASQIVEGIYIFPEDHFGYTNIGAAIKSAREEIISSEGFGDPDQRNVIVILTDGEANWPLDPGGVEYAEQNAEIAKGDGIIIYTIGLGDEINRESLMRIATEPNYYFEAATSQELEGIYEEIALAVCTHGPSSIEISPRHLNAPKNR